MTTDQSGGGYHGDDGADLVGRRRNLIRAATKRGKSRRAARGAPIVENELNAEAVKRPTNLNQVYDGNVFVAYAREDKAVTGSLVERLRQAGASVTWDQDFPAGVDVGQTIRSAIAKAAAVIVVWSDASARSLYVRDEADTALRSDKLVTTHVPGFDPEDVPMGFGQLHTVPIDVPGQVERSLGNYGIVIDG